MGATHRYSAVQSEEEARKFCLFILITVVIMAVVVPISAMSFYNSQTIYQAPHYSITIDSVSGLDPVTDLLNPEFNMTLRVASRGLWATKCAEPGMYVEVSYREVSLAASATLTKQICAGPMQAVEHPLVARGTGVVVPGSMLNSLAMDMRSGVPKFDVHLRGLSQRKVAWCGFRLVGDADALQRECV